MAKNSQKETAIEVSNFFSRKNEEEGKWFEPLVGDVKCGIEFKVYGPNSDANSLAEDIFEKERELADTIEDYTERHAAVKAALLKRTSAVCADIRGANGKELTIHGRPVTKDDIPEIIFQSPILAVEILKFNGSQSNFLG